MSNDKKISAWAWQKERREKLRFAWMLINGETLTKSEREAAKAFISDEITYTEGAIEALEEAIEKGE